MATEPREGRHGWDSLEANLSTKWCPPKFDHEGNSLFYSYVCSSAAKGDALSAKSQVKTR